VTKNSTCNQRNKRKKKRLKQKKPLHSESAPSYDYQTPVQSCETDLRRIHTFTGRVAGGVLLSGCPRFCVDIRQAIWQLHGMIALG